MEGIFIMFGTMLAFALAFAIWLHTRWGQKWLAGLD